MLNQRSKTLESKPFPMSHINIFLKAKTKWLHESIISSSISSSNLTLAEDMEGLISRHIDSALKTSLLYKLFSYIDHKANFLSLLLYLTIIRKLLPANIFPIMNG